MGSETEWNGITTLLRNYFSFVRFFFPLFYFSERANFGCCDVKVKEKLITVIEKMQRKVDCFSGLIFNLI